MARIYDMMRPAERVCFESKDYDDCMDAVCQELFGPTSYYVFEEQYTNLYFWGKMFTNRGIYSAAVAEFKAGGDLFEYLGLARWTEVQGRKLARVSDEICNRDSTEREEVTQEVLDALGDIEDLPEPEHDPVARSITEMIEMYTEQMGIALTSHFSALALKLIASKTTPAIRGGMLLNGAKLPVAAPAGSGFSPILILAPQFLLEFATEDNNGPMGPSA